jgi:hypothetical protein
VSALLRPNAANHIASTVCAFHTPSAVCEADRTKIAEGELGKRLY